jgi:hypothetical protein
MRNQTHNFPACNVVLQAAALPSAINKDSAD